MDERAKERDAGREREGREDRRPARLVEQDGPLKDQGDALRHGSGTRHGADAPEKPPARGEG